ncbi:MAG TPA: hypothetical protein VF226_06665 [Hyphomicrobiaceae bacterium]
MPAGILATGLAGVYTGRLERSGAVPDLDGRVDDFLMLLQSAPHSVGGEAPVVSHMQIGHPRVIALSAAFDQAQP